MTVLLKYCSRFNCFCAAFAARITVLLAFTASAQAEPLDIGLLYLSQPVARPPALSSRWTPPEDLGFAGSQLGIEDSNTTGRFLKQQYSITQATVNSAAEAAEAVRSWNHQGGIAVILDAPEETIAELTTAPDLAAASIFFNATNPADALRSTACTSGLLHTAPSRAMLTDALAQFLLARRWREWFVISGERAEDKAYVDAVKRAAKRFGGKIVEEKTWTFDTDLRRTAQQELPVFTQKSDYDVVIVADELGDVGEFVPYNTWLPRPVAGTQGLTPVGWSPVVEQWGALQLQNRFRDLNGRDMEADDYGAWLAVRAYAEAVTRVGQLDRAALYAYLISDQFELGVFKGRSASFRPWNGQLRQPIPLVQPRAVVSQSPQTGFLHPRTELDTLGYDAPEVTCQFGES